MIKQTPAQVDVETECLMNGLWPREARDEVIKRSGATNAEELATNKELLSETIQQHREEKPGDFLPRHTANEIARLTPTKRSSALYRACYKMRDDFGSLRRAQEGVMALDRGLYGGHIAG